MMPFKDWRVLSTLIYFSGQICIFVSEVPASKIHDLQPTPELSRVDGAVVEQGRAVLLLPGQAQGEVPAAGEWVGGDPKKGRITSETPLWSRLCPAPSFAARWIKETAGRSKYKHLIGINEHFTLSLFHLFLILQETYLILKKTSLLSLMMPSLNTVF